MSGRDPAEAVEQLVGPLQRALSCVTPSVLIGRRCHEFRTPHVLFFEAPSDPSPLGRLPRHFLGVRHFYRLSDVRTGPTDERWRVVTVGYVYEIYGPELGRVFAYHWHPPGSGSVAPHLHIGRQFAQWMVPPEIHDNIDRLVQSPFPTGPIVLPTLLRLTIAEFGVMPLRDDWRSVLDETERDLRRTLSTE